MMEILYLLTKAVEIIHLIRALFLLYNQLLKYIKLAIMAK